MKIVFVLDCYNLLTNGTTATAVRFADELRKRGHEVRVVGCYSDAYKDDKDYFPTKHYIFPVFEPLIRKEGFSFSSCKDLTPLVKAIKGADVVHIFLPFRIENKARLVAKAYDIPVTGAFHLQPNNITSAIHLGHWKFANDCIYLGDKLVTYRYIRHVHCPSKMIADQLSAHHYSNICHVISNGVNLDFFHPIEVTRPEAFKDKYVITMTGRLADEKRQDLLIKAIGKSKYNSRIQLILSGQGPNLHKMEFLAKKCHLANAPLIGFRNQEDLRKLLNYCDLYVHASDAEIEGIAAIEAFACGAVPVISDSKLSATKDFALDEHCLFKHGSSRSLTNRIDYFIEHPEVKDDLKKKYIDYAQSFALDKQVEAMEKMLSEAIADHKAGLDRLSKRLERKDARKIRKMGKKLNKQLPMKDKFKYLNGTQFE